MYVTYIVYECVDDICAVCIYVYHKIYIRIVPCTVSATIIYKTSSSKKKRERKNEAANTFS